jgi:hypothetical protein
VRLDTRGLPQSGDAQKPELLHPKGWDAALSTRTDQGVPNEPREESKLSLLKVLIIAVLLWLGLAILFVWSMYW